MFQGKARIVRRAVCLLLAAGFLRLAAMAHAATIDDVLTSCTPCHGLVVNGIVISEDRGSLDFVERVGARTKARWLRTIDIMIDRQGAEVADPDGLATFLAGLSAQAATPTPTATPSPTPTGMPGSCTGDCDGSGDAAVNELVTMVNIALGNTALSGCTAGDADGSGDITINEVIAAVNNALNGCPA